MSISIEANAYVLPLIMKLNLMPQQEQAKLWPVMLLFLKMFYISARNKQYATAREVEEVKAELAQKTAMSEELRAVRIELEEGKVKLQGHDAAVRELDGLRKELAEKLAIGEELRAVRTELEEARAKLQRQELRDKVVCREDLRVVRSELQKAKADLKRMHDKCSISKELAETKQELVRKSEDYNNLMTTLENKTRELAQKISMDAELSAVRSELERVKAKLQRYELREKIASRAESSAKHSGQEQSKADSKRIDAEASTSKALAAAKAELARKSEECSDLIAQLQNKKRELASEEQTTADIRFQWSVDKKLLEVLNTYSLKLYEENQKMSKADASEVAGVAPLQTARNSEEQHDAGVSLNKRSFGEAFNPSDSEHFTCVSIEYPTDKEMLELEREGKRLAKERRGEGGVASIGSMLG